MRSTHMVLMVFAAALVAVVITREPRGESQTPTPASANTVDSGITRSTRLAGGMPLGGIGCGTFELMTDGSISRATINNNWDQPTGDLKGSFAAIWTSGGGRAAAKALQVKNPYGLPSVEPVEFRAQFPQATLNYPDKELPVKVSLRAFSTLIPHDLKNSSLPAAVFLFRVSNQARGPVEASIAFSWENILGVGGTSSEGAFSDRTGNSIAKEPVLDGRFALRMGARLSALRPESRLRYNATGNYTLMAEANTPETTVTTASWNSLDSVPGWWAKFSKDGTVEGESGLGAEGKVHPVGVAAIKVTLKDGETREIPFAIAWYTPRHWTSSASEYGHAYETSFDDSVSAARYALQNRLAHSALIDEWQGSLTRSSLPAWLSRKLMNDAATLFTNSILTRDGGLAGTDPGPGLFSMLESPVDGKGALGAMDHQHLASGLHAAFFPHLHARLIRQFRAAQSPAGEIPRTLGHLDRNLSPGPGGEKPAESEKRPDAQAVYAYLVYRHYRSAGDQKFLDDFYPSAKHALQFAATLDSDGDGIPEGGSVYSASGKGYDRYSASMWVGALRIGLKMAEIMKDRSFTTELTALLAKATAGTNQSSAADPGQTPNAGLGGVWLAESVGLGGAPSPDEISKLLAAPTSEATGFPSHRVAFLAALMAGKGRAEAALGILRAVDRMNWGAGHPWQAPFDPRPTTGANLSGRSHIANSSSWHYYQALLGFDVDLSEGLLVLAPRIPAPMKTMSAPIFSPTFIGMLDYRPGPRRSTLSFRMDRSIPIASQPVQLQTGAGLTLKRVIIPTHGEGMPEIFASVGRGPVPGKAERDSEGRISFTFETPLKLTAGQLLEFILR